MVNNDHDNNNMGGPPPIDDSWWMAVLEDVEDRFNPKPKRRQHKPHLKREEALTPETRIENETAANLNWEWAKTLYDQDEIINLKVTGYNRGGILVEGNQIQGFVPTSHLVQVTRRHDNPDDLNELLEAYQGKTLRLKIIECNPDRGRVVLSERAAKTDAGRRIELLSDLNEGDCLPGHVTTITDFGVFVDLGGMEGLVHISELSWGRVDHPSNIVAVGDKVNVCVLQIDRERSRVALSLKRLLPNPWESIESRYHIGQITDAVITSVVSFGAFARLEPGLDGLIHASELSKNGNRNIRPEAIFNEGQRVQVSILLIDPNRQRLGLSLHAIYDSDAEDR